MNELRRGVPLERKYFTNTYGSETPASDGRSSMSCSAPSARFEK